MVPGGDPAQITGMCADERTEARDFMHAASVQVLLFVLGLASAATAFVGVVWGLNALLSPRDPNPVKNAPFECGMEQAGLPWSSQRLRFSTVAMLFVLFDAESVLLFAVISRLRHSTFALVEVAAFIGFLALGFVFAWRKGALEWRS